MSQNPYDAPQFGGQKAQSPQLPILMFLLAAIVLATVGVFAYLVVLRG